eukprot:650597_1
MNCKSAPSVFFACIYYRFYCDLVGSYHGSVLRQSRQRFRSNITSSELLCGITTMVLLTSLFIYKLTKVQRSITDATSGECKNLMSTVTKTFILTAASVISYILMDAAYIGQINDIWGRGSVVALLLDHILFALDLVTNFLSIFLGFSYNLHYYMALCGKCHPKCMICLVKEEKINAKADVVEDTEYQDMINL